MNYFELYGLPISFLLDKAELKRKYYELSHKYHPDFHVQATKKDKSQSLDMSSLNNEAYTILSDFDSRLKYILSLKGLFAEDQKHQMPSEFLMDMLEINEQISELEMAFDQDGFTNLGAEIEKIITQKRSLIEPILSVRDFDSLEPNQLESVRDFYLEKRYLLRLKENLNKLATK